MIRFLKCNCKSEKCPAYKKCCFLPTEYHPDRDGKIHILFVGQGGGSEERQKGRPFIGKAGKRLRNQITLAMKRKGNIFGVAFSNVIRDNPEGNRVPTKEELEFCMPHLYKDINFLLSHGLKTVMPLGKAATYALTKSNNPISVDRGINISCEKFQIIPTYHPSYFNFKGIKFTPEKLNEEEDLVIQDILKGI